MTAAALIFIILLTFIIRVYPRYVLPHAISFDTYFHLEKASEIEANHHKIPKKSNKAILGHENTYPYFYHFVLSFFKGEKRLVVERHTGAIFEVVNVVCVFLLSYLLHNVFAVPSCFADPLLESFTISIFYVFLPALTKSNYGPRTYNGSPRILGQSFFNLHILFYFFYAYNHNMLFLALSVLFCALIPFTAKFGIQVLLFLLVLSVFAVQLEYSAVILGSFVLNFIVLPKKIYRILWGQFNHLRYYLRHIQYAHEYFKKPSFSSQLRSYLGQIAAVVRPPYKVRPKVKAIVAYINSNLFLHRIVFIYNIYFFSFISVLVYLIASGKMDFNGFLILAGTLCFFLTIKWLKFLGEPERYLEYITLPVLLYSFAHIKSEIILVLLAFNVIITVINIYEYINSQRQSEKFFRKCEKMFQYINGQSNLDGKVIWPWVSFWPALYFAKQHSKLLSIGNDLNLHYVSPEEFKMVMGNYPYPGKDLPATIRHYNVAYILVEEWALKHYFNTIDTTARDHVIFDRQFEVQDMTFYKVSIK